MARASLTVERILADLGDAPGRLATLTRRVPVALLRARPEPEEWSVVEVLAHLRSCADVWGAQIATILAGTAPRIRAVSPRTWIRSTDYPDLAFTPSLRAFTDQRTTLVATLTDLPSSEWERAADVTGAGAPTRWRVRDVAQRLTEHESVHIGQITRTIAQLTGA